MAHSPTPYEDILGTGLSEGSCTKPCSMSTGKFIHVFHIHVRAKSVYTYVLGK